MALKALSQGFLLAFLLRPTRLVGLSEELALGVVGGWTAYSEPEELVAVIAAFLDYQKGFDAALQLRLGPPIIEIPGGIHENASIELRIGTTHLQPDVGLASALDMMLGLDGALPVVGLVGAQLSSVSMPIATLGGVRGVPQVSMSSTNQDLSNKDSFPYFLRTIPPDSIQAAALWTWVLHFDIALATCLYSAEVYGQGLFTEIQDLARSSGQPDRMQGKGLRHMPSEFATEEARAVLRDVKMMGSRFLIITMDGAMIPGMLSLLHEEGIFGPGWQAVGSDNFYAYQGLNLPVGFMMCMAATRGPKFPELLKMWSRLGPDDIVGADAVQRYSLDRMRMPLDREDLVNLMSHGAPGIPSGWSALAFDAVYTFLVAINQLLHKGVPRSEIRGEVLLQELRRTSFTGISGSVSFNENGDRLGAYELLNVVQGDPRETVRVAVFSASTSEFFFEKSLVWMDGSTGATPPDRLYSCDPGFYKEEQSKQCRACPKGMKCLGGFNATSTACPRGTFARDTGQSACVPCAKGFFAPDTGLFECSPCLPGYEAPDEGMEACNRCEIGWYSAFSGQARCSPCGRGQITRESGAVNSSECLCGSGSFMCGETLRLRAVKAVLCQEGLGPPVQLAGFWTKDSSMGCEFSVLRCRNARECPQAALGTCADGRGGIACNNCKARHYPRENGTCLPCGETDAVPGVIAFIAIPIALLLLNMLKVEPSQDFIRITCIYGTDSPVLKFASRLLACPLACACLLFSWCLSKMLGRPKPLDTVLNLCGLLIFAFYLSIASSLVVPFQCAPNPDQTASMVSDPGIACYSSDEHAALVALAVCGLLSQPLAFLAVATYATVMYPWRVGSGRGLRLMNRYRFLFHRFKPERYKHGLFLLYRNSIVALLPVAVDVPEIQVPVMGTILLASLALQARTFPWRTEQANHVDLALTGLLIIVLLGAAPLLKLNETESSLSLGIFLCIPVVMILVVALLGILRAIVNHFRKRCLYGIFLCHHKGGAGSLCRLMKLLIARHSPIRVFLDCDQLENLDYLFDIVRTETKSVVVVLTTKCAGEITTAWKSNITTVPLQCDGFKLLDEEALKLIPTMWTPQQKQVLANYGVALGDVMSAYVWLQHNLPHLQMPRSGPVWPREEVVREILGRCGVLSIGRRTAYMLQASSRSSLAQARARILIMSSVSDPEILSSCEVLQLMLQAHLRVECAVVYGRRQMSSWKPFAYYLVVVLFRGILNDYVFRRTLTQALAPSKRTLEVLTLIADPQFEFPNLDELGEEEEEVYDAATGSDRTATDSEQAAFRQQQVQALRSLVTVLALPFSPLASEGLQQKQVAEIAGRIHRYKDPAAAAWRDEADDKLTEASLQAVAGVGRLGSMVSCYSQVTAPDGTESIVPVESIESIRSMQPNPDQSFSV
ncbi:Grm5 [Symbiodinium sp. CCMP2456]|nr:Grm5 [Symbiodinium sp. CCMP2456]